MRKLLNIALVLILIVMIWLFYQLYLEYRGLDKEAAEITGRWESLKNENGNLLADLEYFSEDENLEKEVRTKFNYKKAGEKQIIVVSPKEINSTSTSQ